MQVDHRRTRIENDFTLEKARFIENYNLARPIMTILGDEVRQEILLSLIESGGMGGIRVGDIQKKKARFIENYNLARPIMTILGDEVRQEILLSLIESGGMGGIRVGDIQKKF